MAVVATTLAAVDAGLSPALAQCAGPANATICNSGGNVYPGGINVSTSDTPINLTLQSDVIVTIPAGAGGVNAVNAANTGGVSSPADVSITADGVTINNTANPGTSNNTGLRTPAGTPSLMQQTPQLM